MTTLARRLTACLAAIASIVLLAGPARAHDGVIPPLAFPSAVDPYSPYQAESTCTSYVQPGTSAIIAELLRPRYGGTSYDYGTHRACSVGGPSGHKEGRSIDWMMCTCDPHENAHARRFLEWLLAPDAHGNPHAMARRLGVMYVIFDRRVWKAYQPARGWQPYYGASPHTDHVHLSLSWEGAEKDVTFWTTPGVTPGTLGPYVGPSLRVGSTGDRVARFERRLNFLGLLPASQVDAYFGVASRDAAKVLQARSGLVADGYVGQLTWTKGDTARP